MVEIPQLKTYGETMEQATTIVKEAINTKRAKAMLLLKGAKTEGAVTKLLTARIKQLGKECDLDPERLDKSIASAISSEYGRTNALVNTLVSKVYFPADRGDYSNLAANQVLMTERFNFSLIEQIKNHRGYHSFCAEDGTVISGKMPNFEQYSLYVNALILDLADEAKINLPEDFDVKLLITEDQWKAREAQSLVIAKEEGAQIKAAIERSKALMQQ